MIYETKEIRTLGMGECMKGLTKILEFKKKNGDNVWNE